DDANAAAAADAGLTYRGRPGFAGNPVESQQILTHALSRAKFALAFSNRHSPAAYTHPTREYLTARWTTALAAGASVAGIAPRCRATAELLWEGALVEFASVDRREGLERLAAELAAWTPRRALVNRAEALRRLDWRWRFREIAGVLGRTAPALDANLAMLGEKLNEAVSLLGEGVEGERS
nr:glycosyltransferase family 1 protein [Propionibacterium sp.]